MSTKYFHTVAFPQRSCIRVHKKTESMGKRFIPGSGSHDSGAWKSCHLPSRSWRPRTGGDGIIPFRGLRPGAPCQRAGEEDRGPSSTILFYPSPQLIGCCPPVLGRVIFTQPSDSHADFFQKELHRCPHLC